MRSPGGKRYCVHGIFDAKIRRFAPKPDDRQRFKVPQIGWNTLFGNAASAFAKLPQEFYCLLRPQLRWWNSPFTIATTDYVQPFSGGLHKGNFYAVQFHP